MTSSQIEIKEVITRKDFDDFIFFPDTVYAKDDLYVRPLTKELRQHFSHKNPFFLHASVKYFLALRQGSVVGRIASVINRTHISYHNENAGFFGFFESLNQPEIAHGLLNAVSDDLKHAGLSIIRGPMNFSTNEECGLLIDGFEMPPMLMTPYNLPYYGELMEHAGLEKVRDLYAFILDVPDELPHKIHRAAEIGLKKGVQVRHLDKSNFVRDMMIFREVYNSAWANNWGFLPITDEELVYMAKSLKPVVVPELTLIAEKNGEPIGFMGLLPDYNVVLKTMKGKINPITILKALYCSRRIQDLRLLLLGIKPEYRNRGVDALLFREGFKGVKSRGYKRVEFSWILEENIPVQRLVEMIGGSLYKTFRIYEKKL